MNGKVVKIERINTRGVHMVEFAIFDISEKDFLSLQECINSRDDWEIEIRPTLRAVDPPSALVSGGDSENSAGN